MVTITLLISRGLKTPISISLLGKYEACSISIGPCQRKSWLGEGQLLHWRLGPVKKVGLMGLHGPQSQCLHPVKPILWQAISPKTPSLSYQAGMTL